MLCIIPVECRATLLLYCTLSTHRPETGQGIYQDPNTIERHKAPTGDLYTMPDKSNNRGPPLPSRPEMATYQDPNTIERQEAPTGCMYSVPDKSNNKEPPPPRPVTDANRPGPKLTLTPEIYSLVNNGFFIMMYT